MVMKLLLVEILIMFGLVNGFCIMFCSKYLVIVSVVFIKKVINNCGKCKF